MPTLNWIPIICAIIFTAAICYLLHDWDVNRIKTTAAADIKTQIQYDIGQCVKTTQPAIESDSNEVKNLTDNLNACLGKLQDNKPATCVPIIKHSCGVKTAKSPTSGSALGLTSNAIDANNLFCDNQVDGLNNAKDFATECLKNGTCN